jgi:hypothetical protein
VSGFSHRRAFRLVALVLSAFWIVTLVCADTAVTPPLHCQRHHMPCCPASESCSQCTEQVPEQSEVQAITVEEQQPTAAALPAVAAIALYRSVQAPIFELTPGLRFQSSVFRRKDDLRV